MAQSTKEITRRIKSVSNTKKITKAMEMVSASKMKKSVEATLASRFYAQYAWDILTNLAEAVEPQNNPLLDIRKVQSICIILVTSDKGLCGSYNTQIIKKILQQLKDPSKLMVNKAMDQRIESHIDPKDLKVDFIAVGKKGAEELRKFSKDIKAVFSGIEASPTLRDIKPISDLVIKEYKKKTYDKIVVAYTDYRSAILQEPKLRQLLPISKTDLEKVIQELDTIQSSSQPKEVDMEKSIAGDYVFEPNKKKLLQDILVKLVEMQLYQMVMESSASEHSARMLAMKNASDAASDMIDELTLIYNKARQAGITQEIAEISSGKAALEQ